LKRLKADAMRILQARAAQPVIKGEPHVKRSASLGVAVKRELVVKREPGTVVKRELGEDSARVRLNVPDVVDLLAEMPSIEEVIDLIDDLKECGDLPDVPMMETGDSELEAELKKTNDVHGRDSGPAEQGEGDEEGNEEEEEEEEGANQDEAEEDGEE